MCLALATSTYDIGARLAACSGSAHDCCATGDRRWMMVLEGQSEDYHGEAVNPANLSLFELALGYHKVRRERWHQQWCMPDQGKTPAAKHVAQCHAQSCCRAMVCNDTIMHGACVLFWIMLSGVLESMLQAYTHFAATRAQSSSLQQSALEAHADGNGVA